MFDSSNRSDASRYPEAQSERDAWIRALRPNLEERRRSLPIDRPSAWLWESEPVGDGRERPVLTVFLTNRECPWRCLMCDLWQQTRLDSVPPGAIPRQIDAALSQAGSIPAGTRLKLYNAGSFFDPGAIPTVDHVAIADRCRGFDRVLVECHPSLVGDGRRIREFAEQIAPARLEVAMGLETIHPEVLPKLNKRMTPEQFSDAAQVLKRIGVARRAFVLVQPPFLPAGNAVEWAVRSAEFAFANGVEVVALIPTRDGNGAMEMLRRSGEFTPPTLSLFEDAVDAAFQVGGGVLLADVWDLGRFSDNPTTFEARRNRLEAMNRVQRILPRVGAANGLD